MGALRVDLLAAEELTLVNPSLRVRTMVELSMVMFRGDICGFIGGPEHRALVFQCAERFLSEQSQLLTC